MQENKKENLEYQGSRDSFLKPLDAKGDHQTYAIIGAAMEVHNRLGKGFLENVYQEALAIELNLKDIPFVRETDLPILYRGEILKCTNRVDFICFGEIIVELKALDQLGKSEEAQVVNYLKASGFRRALLINFGASRLEYKRYVK